MQFHLIQRQFIAHIKDPQHQPGPAGVPDSRMAVYRELFFNNIQGFVASAFPVLKSLYTPSAWQALVRQFFIRYQCSSPYFLHIAEHFLQFVQQDYQLTAQDPVFLPELAHYEWAELYLATKKLTCAETALASGNIAKSRLALSELAMVLAYPYAVHQISVDYQPAEKGAVQCYLLYRNAEDEVKFVLISPLTAALLQQLHQCPGMTQNELVQALELLAPQFTQRQLVSGAGDILQQFALKGVLVSFQAG